MAADKHSLQNRDTLIKPTQLQDLKNFLVLLPQQESPTPMQNLPLPICFGFPAFNARERAGYPRHYVPREGLCPCCIPLGHTADSQGPATADSGS